MNRVMPLPGKLPQLCLVAACALAAMSGPARAQEGFPNKPVRIIVPYAPGGVADAQARLVGQKLQARWGQTVTVENRPGGNTVIGTVAVAKAPADCSTMLLGTLATVLNDVFYQKLPYNRRAELAEVSLTTRVPNVLVVPNNSPFRTVQELVAYGRANPGKLSYASTGKGGSSHLSGELLSTLAGIDMVHVPYSGGAAAQQDLLPGRVDLMFDSSSIPNINNKRVRALAVPTETRSKLLPNVPTMAEAGFKGFTSVTWFGFYTPQVGGKPPACLSKLARDVAEETQNTEVRARLYALGAEAVGSTPQELVRWGEEELKRWTAVVKRANIDMSK
jgi:tripartite-type tricarboxylate transporter receptor subunit TctC